MQSMNQLDRLEALAQRLIEGVFDRMFQTRLPPAMIHKTGDKNGTKTEGMMRAIPIQKASQWLLRFEEQELRLGEPVVRIGRALDNDIVLNDPAVSRYHAQLRWRNGCYHLCPPTPTNGGTPNRHTGEYIDENQPIPQTTVNHQQVIQHPLTRDDVITLGGTKLTVLVETGPA